MEGQGNNSTRGGVLENLMYVQVIYLLTECHAGYDMPWMLHNVLASATLIPARTTLCKSEPSWLGVPLGSPS